jgi:hypothetical protein
MNSIWDTTPAMMQKSVDGAPQE